MDKAKRAKISQLKSRTGKAIWSQMEREWEEENRSATGSREIQGQPAVQQTPAILPVAEPPVQLTPDTLPVEEAPVQLLEDVVEESFLNYEYESSNEDQDEYNDDRAHKNQVFVKELRLWALKNKITHVALNELLQTLRKTTDFYLPKDSRTLLKTPIGVGKELLSVAGGQLWYQGIENCLRQFFGDIVPSEDSLWINISMDGLPLHNSGAMQFWPILMQLYAVSDAPIMVIGIFSGTSKPENAEDYLRPLVSELNNITDSGIIINGRRISVALRAIIADSPARAFIKGVAYHNGIHACLKCKIMGRSYQRRMIFEGLAEVRTDAEFRSGAYCIGHQKRPTPLADIKGIDMIKDIPIADDLHLLYLGIMKLLLLGFILGLLKPFKKWTLEEQDEISNLLLKIKLPIEINRSLRVLKYIKFWKGSEFRTFLHHISIPLLKGRITDSAYHHFKLFFMAVTILSSRYFQQHWQYAEMLLNQFVVEFSAIYDRSYLTYNVHNLVHVAADVKRFGPLPSISSFPFENKLQHLKRLVRTGHRCLSQVVGRLVELQELETASEKVQFLYPFLKTKQEETILHVRSDFILRQGNRNGWFLTKNNEIVRYSKAIETGGLFFIEGHKILRKKPSFSYPRSSDVIFNFVATIQDLSSEVERVNVSDVKCKLVAVSLDEGVTFHFSPLIHTLQ